MEQYGNTGLGAFPAMGNGTVEGLRGQNAVQTYFLKTSRLSIPVTFHAETLHSSAASGTIFPMPVGQGSTWDTEIVRMVAAANARQARAGGIDRGFSPEINVCTDPRFGVWLCLVCF